jgi:hypothetical protein
MTVLMGFLTVNSSSTGLMRSEDLPSIPRSQYQLLGDEEAVDRKKISTIGPIFKGLRLSDNFLSMNQTEYQSRGPVEVVERNTAMEQTFFNTEQVSRRFSAPLVENALVRPLEVNSTPIQIWEGTVVSIDRNLSSMHVLLDAKMGHVPRHSGDIELEWVAEQDQDLVEPGAIFYLTLFKRTRRGSIENAQELRFRRRPSWSAVQIKQIEQGAEMIRSKMKPLPMAE